MLSAMHDPGRELRAPGLYEAFERQARLNLRKPGRKSERRHTVSTGDLPQVGNCGAGTHGEQHPLVGREFPEKVMQLHGAQDTEVVNVAQGVNGAYSARAIAGGNGHMGVGVTELRYRNARRLVDQAGNFARFGERLGMSKAQVSHLLGESPIKGIGHAIARRIEVAFNLPTGWLDTDHDAIKAAQDRAQARRLPGEVIEVHALDIPGLSQVFGVRSIVLAREWCRRHLPASSASKLAIASITGDSMAPTITEGSIAILDTGEAPVTDGVYVLQRESVMVVRRLQVLLEGGVQVRCDNPSYAPQKIDDLATSGVRILGRVVWTWVPGSA